MSVFLSVVSGFDLGLPRPWPKPWPITYVDTKIICVFFTLPPSDQRPSLSRCVCVWGGGGVQIASDWALPFPFLLAGLGPQVLYARGSGQSLPQAFGKCGLAAGAPNDCSKPVKKLHKKLAPAKLKQVK